MFIYIAYFLLLTITGWACYNVGWTAGYNKCEDKWLKSMGYKDYRREE